MTLTEFLLARIAEDEAVAAAAVSRRDGVDKWEAVGSGTVVGPGYDKVKHVMLPSSEDGAARHIARHDPARVLAECEAKRAIANFADYWRGDANDYGQADQALRIVSAVYAGHEDYRQEWKP